MNMLLAVDIGNTNTVIGLFEGDVLLAHFRISTGSTRTLDETWVLLTQLLTARGIPPESVSRLGISSVVPDSTFLYQKMAESYFQVQALTINYRSSSEVRVTYPDPDSLGADRFCNAVAAKHKYGDPVVVIDFGTATSFDIVNSAGEFVGGVIAPGIRMGASLHRMAAQLPKFELNFPNRVIGDSTIHAMQSGIMWGTIAMIEGLIQRISSELGEHPTVVATGGLAKVVAPKTEVIQHIDPWLVLDGIRIICNGNPA